MFASTMVHTSSTKGVDAALNALCGEEVEVNE